MKAEVEQLMTTFNTHREDLQKKLVQAQEDKETMMEFQKTLYVPWLVSYDHCGAYCFWCCFITLSLFIIKWSCYNISNFVASCDILVCKCLLLSQILLL